MAQPTTHAPAHLTGAIDWLEILLRRRIDLRARHAEMPTPENHDALRRLNAQLDDAVADLLHRF